MISSGLARIEVKIPNPFELFKEWRKEAHENHCPGVLFHTLNLATSSSNNSVSNRIVVLRELLSDGFTFYTDGRSKKIQQITENNSVAASFLFTYTKQNQNVVRQVRIEGTAEKLDDSYGQKYFENQRSWEKVRSNVCDQDKEVDYNALKSKVDEMLQKTVSGEADLKWPKHDVAYKILPKTFDFYYAWDEHIADRVFFTKKSDGEWSYIHLAA